jgi:hypothetical protein
LEKDEQGDLEAPHDCQHQTHRYERLPTDGPLGSIDLSLGRDDRGAGEE